MYAATIGGTGLSIPRQVGKTFLVAAIVFALCLLRPGLTVIWTAHRMKTAEETFGKMLVFAKRPKIAPHIDKTPTGSGDEAIIFANTSRILFGARERGFGRGFDEVDVLIFDEAQILGESALDDMVPAANQSRQDSGALLLFLGTPPKPSDKGEVFARMRSEALSGEDEDTGWIEFGADPGYTPTPLPAPLSKADWEQVAKANPSFPEDTPREAILRMRKKLGPDSFLREGLGIWDEDAAHGPIPMSVWLALADTSPQPPRPVGKVAFAVETSPDRRRSSITVVGGRPDGMPQVQVVESRDGADWAIERLVSLSGSHQCYGVFVDKQSPAAFMADALRLRGVPVEDMDTADVKQAFAMFYDATVETRLLRHLNQEELNDGIRTGNDRMVGDAKLWDRKVTVPAVVAATNALWGWTTRTRSADILQAVW
ncbi:MAG TPA: terminase [Mycobacteriales bacterium]|nr:terminase [Mycobacteriales bacterium]